MSETTETTAAPAFRERLWPAPSLFIALLLIIPAVALAATPISPAFAIPIAIGVFVVIVASLLMSSPVLSLENGTFTAGRASIDVAHLGRVETLGAEELRVAIGPGLDARAHLMIRGYIHRGVRVEITDPQDPAPYWVITTRRPEALAAAIAAQSPGSAH